MCVHVPCDLVSSLDIDHIDHPPQQKKQDRLCPPAVSTRESVVAVFLVMSHISPLYLRVHTLCNLGAEKEGRHRLCYASTELARLHTPQRANAHAGANQLRESGQTYAACQVQYQQPVAARQPMLSHPTATPEIVEEKVHPFH
ncbi:hypothetical protein VTK56DRAFT_2773 [Thermocarpiscus australiensis]